MTRTKGGLPKSMTVTSSNFNQFSSLSPLNEIKMKNGLLRIAARCWIVQIESLYTSPIKIVYYFHHTLISMLLHYPRKLKILIIIAYTWSYITALSQLVQSAATRVLFGVPNVTSQSLSAVYRLGLPHTPLERTYNVCWQQYSQIH